MKINLLFVKHTDTVQHSSQSVLLVHCLQKDPSKYSSLILTKRTQNSIFLFINFNIVIANGCPEIIQYYGMKKLEIE